MIKKTISNMPNSAPIVYYSILAIVSMSWPVYYQPEITTTGEIILAMVHNASVIGIFLFLDLLIYWKYAGILLRGMALIYVFFVHLSSLALFVTGISFSETLKILSLGGELFSTVVEAGYPWYTLILLIPLLILILLSGYGISCISPFSSLKKSQGIVLMVALLIIPGLLIVEQAVSKDSPYYYTRRHFPGSVSLYFKNKATIRTTLKKDFSVKPGVISNARVSNKKNVVFILLESFRYDAVTKMNTPHLHNFTENNINFTNAYTNGIYTALAWNALLMNMPVWTVSRDAIKQFGMDRLDQVMKQTPVSDDLEKLLEPYRNSGSLIFRLLKSAGYKTGIISSANMDWFRFIQRIKGGSQSVDYFYSPYRHYKKKPRNWLDRVTVHKTKEYIEKNNAPFFLVVQLDASHWTYYPDKQHKKYLPQAESINALELTSKELIKPVYNRYRNAIATVDENIGKILKSLKDKGIYNDTAVVIVSDHGESFMPGKIGHTAFHKSTIKIHLSMHLPGMKKFNCSNTISHYDVFPTLFTYLGLSGNWQKYMLGSNRLGSCSNENPILVFHSSLNMAKLVLSDRTVHYSTLIIINWVSATPVFVRYHDTGKVKMISDDYHEYNKIMKKMLE